ncbi:MAG: hypothetical protein IJI35_01845 [Kiritimatiellae bacterium]|nr:hypothetical protein [Kiritimatiellia bacterium]MBQ6327733.1 hypothetical protein [Kiritimatiellia bacterium]
MARNRVSKARGFDKRVASGSPTATPQKIYNCVSFENSNADIANASYCTISNTYTTSTSAELLYDAVNGDFRLSPGTPAVGGGLTEFLSLISLPEGISAYKDYAGNDIDPESETCDPGCIQGAVVANGVTLQDGMSISIDWKCPVAGVARFGSVRVTGEGTLTVTRDGVPFATYTSEDGEKEFSFMPAGTDVSMTFSFVGEGSADVFGFSAQFGTLLLIK